MGKGYNTLQKGACIRGRGTIYCIDFGEQQHTEEREEFRQIQRESLRQPKRLQRPRANARSGKLATLTEYHIKAELVICIFTYYAEESPDAQNLWKSPTSVSYALIFKQKESCSAKFSWT